MTYLTIEIEDEDYVVKTGGQVAPCQNFQNNTCEQGKR